MALLKFYREKFKQLKYKLKKTGSGLQFNNKKINKQQLIWQNVETAFNSRLLSGVIINLSIKGPIEFFRQTLSNHPTER